MIGGILLALIPVILIGAILAFEVWMFVDALKNPLLKDNERVLWCVGMVLIHPFVAIAYYVVARTGRPV